MKKIVVKTAHNKASLMFLFSFVLGLFFCSLFLSAEAAAAEEVSEPEKAETEQSLTPIMGIGTLSAEKMYAALRQNNKNSEEDALSDHYIKEFVLFVISEAAAEGVDHDVAFALMMHETGWLTFGGDVSREQNNFGGLGATGGGAEGASFSDVKTGIRAVVQHLKCYACEEAMLNEVADPRFSERLRSLSPYVEWLGAADNPYGTGWASPGEGYGLRLLAVIDRVRLTDDSGVDLSKIKAPPAQGETQPIGESESTLRIAGLALMLYAVSKMLKRSQWRKVNKNG